MRDTERVATAADPALPCRRRLVRAVRRVLWERLRKRPRGRLLTRSLVRRRLGDFLARSAAGRLLAILRSAALTGTAAAALCAPGGVLAQDFPPVELAAIARGEGGFAARGEGIPPSQGKVAGAGDVNGDGIPDVIVGWARGFNYSSAPTHVVFGKPGGGPVELADILEGRGGGFAIRGAAEPDGAGSSFSAAGDVSGDGLDDVIVAAPTASPGGRQRAGESYVVFGRRGSDAVELSDVREGRGGFAIRGLEGFRYSFRSVSGAGDVNGDGLADLIVSGPPEGGGGLRDGESYVVFGRPRSEPVELSDVLEGRGGFAIRGVAGGAGVSHWNVSGAGDASGDGLADIIIGIRGLDRMYDRGQVHVVFGKPGGEAVELSEVGSGRGGFSIGGAKVGDFLGWSIAGGGDVNGDGLADIIAGAPAADPEGREDAGETYVVFGKPGGESILVSNIRAGNGGFAIRGAAHDMSGLSVSTVGDADGDGLADILIHADQAKIGVVSGKTGSEAVELSEVLEGRGGFAIRGAIDGASGFRDPGSVSGIGDMDGDGHADVIIADPEVPPAGESYVVFAKPGGEAVELPEVRAGRGGFAIRGVVRDNFSIWSVSGAGDVNGDGLEDLILGAPLEPPGGKNAAGESYVLFGKADGQAVRLPDIQAGAGGFAIRGAMEDDLSGQNVSGAGDVNGDGLTDLVIAAPRASRERGSYAGEIYVVFGKTDGEPVEVAEIRAGRGGFAVGGASSYGYLGSGVASAGDVGGDGLADLILGARGETDGPEAGDGESYVIFGKPGGEFVDLRDVRAGLGGFAINGVARSDSSGSKVSGAGDVNGDGLPDLVIGAPWSSPGGRTKAGQTYVVLGKTGGEPVELREVQSGRGGFGFVVRGAAENDFSGASVAGAGDVDGDGLADIIIGAPGAPASTSRYGSSQSYVVFGKTGGEPVDLRNVEMGLGGFMIRDAEGDTGYGQSVSGAGDVSGDGLADLIIGERGTGQSHVVFGKPGGEPIDIRDVREGRGGFAIRGAAEGDGAGRSVSGAGDLNGDGLPDLAIAANLVETRYSFCSGAAYVVFGNPAWRVGAPQFRRGDCNGDGTVGITDPIHALRSLFLGGDDPVCDDSCDSDDDGAVSITDAIVSLGVLFLGEGSIPPPGISRCGIDPTDDGIGCIASDPCP